MLLVFLLLPSLCWAALEDCFERIRNHTLIGTTVVTLDDVTLAQCQHACLEAKKQSCRSLMYHAAKKRCYMNSEDMKTRASQFFPILEAVDYYHRTCYYKPSSPVKRESVFEDSCYEIIKGKVLIGIVDQLIQDVTSLDQCKRRCQKSKEASDIICKSAIYYEKDRECIIASQSRMDIPDLFIEDDQAVYIENTCLNQSGANMKKLKNMAETVSETTQQTTTSTTEPHNIVELSGYETPSETVSNELQADVITTSTPTTTITTTTTTEIPTTSFDAKVIDSYNVDPVVKSPPTTGYGRRLRDSRVKDCFTALDLCALSSMHIIDGGSMQELDGIVYHNRHDC
ncbi:unnamed protein product [Strongylus vulgaris]|uniref:Apple domain-containing protein n=1 Tax=Strongylus vulgaris TaxID=40348 RepID=A0A3P7JE85_STRVU|nr:unnamed protein product [Strongylus vulgaris]